MPSFIKAKLCLLSYQFTFHHLINFKAGKVFACADGSLKAEDKNSFVASAPKNKEEWKDKEALPEADDILSNKISALTPLSTS